MITVDGSHGEGGGQILRAAAAFSLLTGEEVRIHSIRAKRPTPGLKPQHLASLKGLTMISSTRVEGLRVGSTEVVIRPGRLRGGNYRIDIGTAGSVTLLLQTLLPAVVDSGEDFVIEVSGGTAVKWAPQAEYFQRVLFPLLNRYGFSLHMEIIRRGYYPRGGGLVRVACEPSSPREIRVDERGHSIERGAVVHQSSLPSHVAERAARTLRELGYSVEVVMERGPGPGMGVALWAEYAKTVMGSDALGERGVRAEEVAHMAHNALQSDISSPATVDIHASDMLLLFAPIAGARYTSRALTGHAETMVWLLNMFYPGSAGISGSPPTFTVRRGRMR
jgi:RNA 3'-phosphate cyclase